MAEGANMPNYCPYCGSATVPGSEYCPQCLMRLAPPPRQEAVPTPPRPESVPVKRARDPIKIVLSVMVVVLITALAISFTQGTLAGDEESQLAELQNQLSALTASYSSLQGQYNILNGRYNTLNSSYSTLQAQYDSLESQCEMSSELRIDVTLATYYDYVRDHVSKTAIQFEADVAAHDAGHLYWPSLEEETDYVAHSGTNESADRTAFRIISKFLSYADIKSGDSDVVKIDKIMRLVNSYITYERRSNGEIQFPTEVLTYRSGDCTGFTVLTACLLEEVGIQTATGYFEGDEHEEGHSMVLVHMDDLGSYGYSYFSDLTSKGLSAGRWIAIEPQDDSLYAYSNNLDWVNSWSLISASEVPYGA